MPVPGEQPSSGLPSLEPGAVFAGYRIERLLDRGGMGLVYEATDPHLGRTVALKIIAPEFTGDETAVARFKAEARLAASLEHPNIVPVHGGGEQDGVLYLAMRYVPGSNLRKVIDREPLDPARTSRIVSQVADALDVSHDRGLVHRDVKPGNVLIAREGTSEHAYLTDFGVTKQVGGAPGLTRTGGWVGTTDYVAPEQIQGNAIDGRADVYSLGCMVYEMLTGRVPYPLAGDAAKLWAHITDPPALPRQERPELDEAFDRVVGRATAKKPEDRYSTAGELAADLRDAVGRQEADETKISEPETRLSAGAPETVISGAPVREPTGGRGSGGGGGGGEEPPGDGPGGDEPGREGGGPRRGVVLAGGALAAVALVAVLLVSGVLGGGGGEDGGGDAVERAADLVPVPTNKVDGSGSVKLALNGDEATVNVDAEGLVDGEHLQHIHADGRDRCPTAAAARRHNGNRAITGADGVPDYGRPLTSLTISGDTSIQSAFADASRYPAGSNVRYERTFDLGRSMATRIRNGEGVIVVHGIDWDRDGRYGAVLQGATIPKDELSGELTAPALCAPLNPQTSADGSTTTYVATLPPQPVAHAWEGPLCRLHGLDGSRAGAAS